jgi:hypothetical protein
VAATQSRDGVGVCVAFEEKRWDAVCPEGIGVAGAEVGPDAVAELLVAMVEKVAGDGVPEEELRVVGTVAAALQRFPEDLFRARVRGALQPSVGLTQRQEIEEVGRGSRVDVAAVFLSPMIEDHDGWQPDHVQVTYFGIPDVETQRNETRLDSGNDRAVWIHYGIQ